MGAIRGITRASDRNIFISSIIVCVCLISGGGLIIINSPKELSTIATFDGVLVELNRTEYSINVAGLWNYGAYDGYVQKKYDFTKDDMPNICHYIENCKSDSVRVRIWAEKNQARQIEMNGTIVKRYDWWKYAKPALWLMILPGSIFLILLILDRKRLLKEPESKK